MTQVSDINMGDAAQVQSVGFPGPRGIALAGFWGMNPVAGACALALDASVAGSYGASPAVVSGMAVSKTINGAGEQGRYLAAGDVIAMWAGKRVVEGASTVFSGVTATQAQASLVLAKPDMTKVLLAGYTGADWVFRLMSGLTVLATWTAAGSASAVPAVGIDGTTGDAYGWLNGTLVMDPAAPASSAAGFFSGVAIVVPAIDLSFQSVGTLGMTMVQGAGSMAHSYAGFADLCGNAADAALPTSAKPGDVLEVTAAGVYGGQTFAAGDLAVVHSNGTTASRIPAAGMSSSEIAAAIAAAVAAGVAQAEAYAVQRGNHTGSQAISTVTGLQPALDAKLDSSAYVQHFLGKYVSVVALQLAYPAGQDGDYAIVDAGAGAAARQYVWDAEAGWIDSGDIKSGTTTDQLAEGSSNLFFTAARVRDTVLTGLSTATNAVITAADSVLTALGKLQAQVSALVTSVAGKQDAITNVTWSQLQAINASTNQYKRYFVTDIGPSGSEWFSNGTDWVPHNGHVLLARSAVASSVTGTTNETSLATITIPAGVMGQNGQLRITTLWSNTNAAINKVMRVRFGGAAGTIYTTHTNSTNVAGQACTIVRNRNSASSQVGFSTLVTSFGVASTAVVTSSVNTAAETTVVLTAALANGSETATLESYTVELVR